MWWYVMLAASVLSAASGGVALGCISIYSPFKLSRWLANVLVVWIFPGVLIGIGLMPKIGHGEISQVWTFTPAVAWLLALWLTERYFRWRYPPMERGQYILPL